METDCLNFCQKDFMRSSFTSFAIMREKKEFVDFKFTVQDRIFFAHRLVLAARIPYWKHMLANSGTGMPIEGIDPDVFESIINFAYSGEIKITKKNAKSLFIASQLLEMTQLYEACIKFLSIQINIHNVFQIRTFAGNNRSFRTAGACDLFILRNFQKFTCEKPEEFYQLPFSYLQKILGEDDLNAIGEEIVFEAVIKWVQACPVERHVFLPKLLRAVRMKKFSVRYLVERVSTEELILTSPICQLHIACTKACHLFPKDYRSSLYSTETCSRNTIGHGLYAICSSELGSFLEVCDIARGVWITLTKICDIEPDGAVGYNGKLYFFRNSATEIETFDVRTYKMEKFTTSRNTFVRGESVERVVLHHKKFYLFTGNKMYCFDPEEKKWMGLQTVIDCSKSGIASLGKYIYITGGYIKHSATNVSRRYDTRSGKQYNISPMLQARSGHGCAALNNMVYVCAGYSADGSEVYDPLTDKWSLISRQKRVSHNCSLVSFKGKLYVVQTDDSKSVCEAYDPKSLEWIQCVPNACCCNHMKYVVIPLPDDDKGCPEFGDLRLRL